MNWIERTKAVNDAIDSFPAEFGLRAFPNKRFFICAAACFHNGKEPILYVYTKEGLAFSKGTKDELLREIVK